MSNPGTVYLTEAECWSLLNQHVVARLAVDIAGRPDIFPINYVVDAGSIVFRSGAGTKLAGAVLGRHVAVEIDGLDIHFIHVRSAHEYEMGLRAQAAEAVAEDRPDEPGEHHPGAPRLRPG